ncbi:CG34460 [Drosophila busckii]|uniref:CG34460 n=1 Tax=Drosophila busckii TaxID=30019 RepID=A0A0M4EAJ2_DROBS|nr:uncharacterized protein LOC108594874 [Drosophila busckii]ALC42108.1 CG34460 [Drosophila busckii]
MQLFYLNCLALIALSFYASALVGKLELGPAGNGCKGSTGELAVGAMEQDNLTCGIVVCQNKQGLALVHFCQKTVAFANCEDDGVLTTGTFPDCCWQCVNMVDCENRRQVDHSDTKSIEIDDISSRTNVSKPKLFANWNKPLRNKTKVINNGSSDNSSLINKGFKNKTKVKAKPKVKPKLPAVVLAKKDAKDVVKPKLNDTVDYEDNADDDYE